jgi:hypothetical protein
MPALCSFIRFTREKTLNGVNQSSCLIFLYARFKAHWQIFAEMGSRGDSLSTYVYFANMYERENMKV